MEYSTFGNLKISKMTLGTVQLGLQYGIANKTGKPNLKTSQEILHYASKCGINTFDTAPVYGNSEEIIGSYLSTLTENKFFNPPIIVTKLPVPSSQKDCNFDEVYEMMKNSILRSLKKLHLKKIRICMLHNATPLDFSKYKDAIIDSLLKLKDEDLIENFGATVYSPEDVFEFLKIHEFGAIQVPLNLFDIRLLKSHLLHELAQRKIIIFARSIFLQGLFFLKADNIPPNLRTASKYLDILRKLSFETEIPVAQLALCFVRDLPEISSLVIGVETKEQLEANLALFSCPSLPKDVKEQIITSFTEVPEQILNPSMWKI